MFGVIQANQHKNLEIDLSQNKLLAQLISGTDGVFHLSRAVFSIICIISVPKHSLMSRAVHHLPAGSREIDKSPYTISDAF